MPVLKGERRLLRGSGQRETLPRVREPPIVAGQESLRQESKGSGGPHVWSCWQSNAEGRCCRALKGRVRRPVHRRGKGVLPRVPLRWRVHVPGCLVGLCSLGEQWTSRGKNVCVAERPCDSGQESSRGFPEERAAKSASVSEVAGVVELPREQSATPFDIFILLIGASARYFVCLCCSWCDFRC